MNRLRESKNRLGLGRKVIIGVIAAAALAACDSQPDATTDKDRATACLSNGLDGRSTTNLIDVPGEAFDIKATYSTQYDVEAWKITDTKTFDIKFEMVPDEGAPESVVLIENLHADASIKSTKSAINGLPADSFDDHLHTGDQPGFLISPEYPYSESFVIGGFSETLTKGWGFVVSGSGSLDVDEKRLTEGNLRSQGAYGEQVAMVTDILVRNPDEEFFHKVILSDAIIIPLAGHDCASQPAATTTTIEN